MAKWDRQARKAIRRRVKELMGGNPKLKFLALAEKLNAEGFKCPDGRPITDDAAGAVARSVGFRKTRRRRGARAQEQQLRLPIYKEDDTAVLMDLVIDANLSDTVKIKMLKSLRERGL